jgi:tRNA1Val (adenine37-N6)-methyltransferase
MTDYNQPDFYRFNEDSFKLVRFVQSHISEAHHILDLCAGCGVIGMELARSFKSQLTLVEVQADYLPFLESNAEQFLLPGCQPNILISSLSEFSPEVYDLIVCNPPYYLPSHGQRGTDARRDTARTFSLDGWKVLLQLIAECLTPEGRAFLVIKDQMIIRQEIRRSLPPVLILSEIREGDLVYLELVRLNKN